MIRYLQCADGVARPALSASAASLWLDCPRAWGHRYIDGLRTPSTAAQLLGTAAHAQVERYYRREIDSAEDIQESALETALRLGYKDALTRVRRLVKAFLVPGVLPPRGERVTVEGSLRVEGAHAVWQGYVDLQVAPASAGDAVQVLDHKTTGDLKYALTPGKLAHDRQAVIYSHAALQTYPESDSVELQWTYVQKHGRAVAHPVRAVMSRAEADERFERLDGTTGADIARVLREGARSGDLPQDWGSCDHYGGCPYRDRCGPRPLGAALKLLMGDTDMQQRQTLFQTLGGQPAPTPAPAAQAQAPAPALPPPLPNPFAVATQPDRVNPPGSPAHVKYPELYEAAGGKAPPVPAPASVSSAVSFPIAPAAPSAALAPAPAEPPEAQAAPQPAPCETCRDSGIHQRQVQDQITGDVRVVQEPCHACPRGKYRGQVQSTHDDVERTTTPTPAQAHAPAQQQVAGMATPPAPAPDAVPPAQHLVAPPAPALTHVLAPGSHGYVLCVGCTLQTPAAVRGCSFAHIVQRAHAVVRERTGHQDYRLIEYGAGKGLMRYALLQALDEAQLGADAFLYVDHLGPEWEIAGAEVTARAGIVARAVAA